MTSREHGEHFTGQPEIPADMKLQVIESARNLRAKLRTVNSGFTELMRIYDLPTTEQYVIHSPANEVVPVPHDRFTLGPRKGFEAVDGVEQLRIRIPAIDGLDPTSDDEPAELEAVDIFFELVKPTLPRPERYLLNPAGFWPYFDSADIEPNMDFEVPGMFTVPGVILIPKDIEAFELLDELLNGVYRPVQVDNRPADAA